MTILRLQVAGLVVFAWLLRGLERESKPQEIRVRVDPTEKKR